MSLVEQNQLIGCRFSLLQKNQERVEGILEKIDLESSFIILSKGFDTIQLPYTDILIISSTSVKKFGTENREVEHYVPPEDKIFPVISFHAHDVEYITLSENVFNWPLSPSWSLLLLPLQQDQTPSKPEPVCPPPHFSAYSIIFIHRPQNQHIQVFIFHQLLNLRSTCLFTFYIVHMNLFFTPGFRTISQPLPPT